VSGQPPLDLDAVARLANAVRSRHCEPGGDRQSYNLAQAALRLLAERDAETAGYRRMVDHQAKEYIEQQWAQLLAGPPERVIAEQGHRYLSTACLHGEHDYCAGKTRQDGGEKVPAKCKFCEARCVCGCHGEGGDG
jgi:hypothetical protein